MAKKINIAIDGFSSCGKSTLAKALAKDLKYIYVDSGAMYRAVTLYCMRNDIIHEDQTFQSEEVVEALKKINISFNYNRTVGDSDTYLNGECVEDDIRTMEVSQNVSAISKIKEVREKLVTFQKQLGKKKGVVMDGRDIGTVVFPDAQLKIFMTASIDVRVGRRFSELKAKGHQLDENAVRENLMSRDLQDSTRKINPLRQAEDAIVLDNTELSHSQQLAQAKSWVETRS
jgi:cytidylate kinase